MQNYTYDLRTYSTPCAVCRAMSTSWYISNLVSATCKCLYSVDPSHHCVTMVISGIDVQPMNKSTLAWRVFLVCVCVCEGGDAK